MVLNTPMSRLKEILKSTDAAFFTLALALCVDQLLLGRFAAVSFFDTIEIHFPHYQTLGRLLFENGLFSWYPNVCGGVPAFAGQHPPYALPSLLASFLPLWTLSLIWNLLRVVVSGYGMYRLLSDFLGVDRRVAVLGGLFFCLAWQVSLVLFVLTYAFPLFCVWTFELARGGLAPRGRWLRAAGLLLLSFISYPVLTLPYSPMLHLLLVLLFRRDDPFLRRHVALVFLVWTAYVLLFVPNILSLYQYIPFIHRIYPIHFEGVLPALAQLGRLLAGSLAGNDYLPILIVALPCLVSTRRLRIALALMLAPILIFCIFTPEAQVRHFFQGSFLLKMDLSNARTYASITLVLGFFLALDEMRRRSAFPKAPWLVLAAAAVALGGGSADKVLLRLFPLGAYLAGLAVLLPEGRGRAGRLSAGARWTLLAFFLAGWAMMARQDYMGNTMSVPYAKVFDNHPELTAIAREQDKAPFRVACVDVHPFVAMSHGLETFGQKGPVFNRNYKHYAKAVLLPQLERYDQVEWFDSFWHYIFFSRTENRGPYIDSITLTPSQPRTVDDYSLPLLLAMNVRYILSTSPVLGLQAHADLHQFSPGRGLPIAPAGGRLDREYALPLHIYRLTDAFERGYLAGAAVVLDSDEAVFDVLTVQTLDSMRDTVFLNRQDPALRQGLALPGGAQTGAASPGGIILKSATPDRLVFEGSVARPCLLVVTNNHHPGWTATVNGHPAPVLRANIAFQAVPLAEPGPVRVELTFRSPLVWWSHAATGLGILLLLGLGFARSGGSGGAAAAARLCPAPDLGASAPRWRALAGGALAAAFWAGTFYLFVYTRDGGRTSRQLLYLLLTTPLLGLALGLWLQGLRGLCPGDPAESGAVVSAPSGGGDESGGENSGEARR